MTSRNPLQLVIGGGGALLIGSLFMPWEGDLSGWELFSSTDVFLLIVGVVALVAAFTGGRVGLFRPDVSFNGAADLLSVVATIVLAWLAIFEYPDGTSREVGLYLALAASIAIACAAGDYRPFRGASLFPRLDR